MRRSLLPLLLALSTACHVPAPKASRRTRKVTCPREVPAPPTIPFQNAEHLLARFWIDRSNEPGRLLLDTKALVAHNQRVAELTRSDDVIARVDLLRSTGRLPRARLLTNLDRLDKAIAQGRRVLRDGLPPRTLTRDLRHHLLATVAVNEVRVAIEATPLRCYANDRGIFESPRDLAFDLAQCAELRFGETVRVLGRGPQRWFVQAAYSSGWVRPGTLSRPLSHAEANAYLHPKHAIVVVKDRVGLWTRPTERTLIGVARLGLHLPLLSAPSPAPGSMKHVAVQIIGPQGPSRAWILRPRSITFGPLPLTRAAFFRRAFALINTPYGWGGMGEHRDCSRLLMDLFASFDVFLPRNSRQQSKAGTERLDVAGLDEAAKTAAIERAARRGIVLLYLPGHIMLYVGRDNGHLFALHQFSGYLIPCSGGGETMRRVNRATVTALDLGRGTSRHAFIERITRLIVFAPPSSKSAESHRSKEARVPSGSASGPK